MNRKFFLPVATLLILVVGIAGYYLYSHPQRSEIPNWKTYRSAELGFEVSYPPTWIPIEESNYDGQYVGFKNPEWGMKGYSETIAIFKNITWEDAVSKAGFGNRTVCKKYFTDLHLIDDGSSYCVVSSIGPSGSVQEVVINGMQGLSATINNQLFTIEDNTAVAGDGRETLLYATSSAVIIYGEDDLDASDAMVQSLKFIK